MRPMTIYLAGPMTGLPAYNHPAFNRTADKLRALGHVILNPSENFGGDQTLPYAQYLRAALAMVLQAEAIALMPGWRRSLGARLELLVAQLLGLRVYDARFLIELDDVPKVRMILGDAL